MKRLLPVITIALLSLTACKSTNPVTPTASPTPLVIIITPTTTPTPTLTPIPTPPATPSPTPSDFVSNGLNGNYVGQVIPKQGSPAKATINVSQSGGYFSGSFTFSIPGHTITGAIGGTENNNAFAGELTPASGNGDCDMALSNVSWIPNTAANSATLSADYSTNIPNCSSFDVGSFSVSVNR